MTETNLQEKITTDLLTNLVMAMLEQGCPMDTPIAMLDGVTLGDLVEEEA